MNKNKVTVNELIEQLLLALRRNGYSEGSIHSSLVYELKRVSDYYQKAEVSFYEPAITLQYLSYQERRFGQGEISKSYLYNVRSIVRKLNEFYLTGTIRIYQPTHATIYQLLPENERLIDLFLDWKGYGTNTRDDALWATRKYLRYMEQHGRKSIDQISPEDARQFIVDTAKEVRPASMHNILLYIRHFYIFLKQQGTSLPDYSDLFSYTVYRDMPIQACITDEELESILSAIDTNTISGKRDKAIILLAATTGLRAIDIIHLKLRNIDWRKGEICIMQQKTSRMVYLPLITESASAIKEYILNARPMTEDEEVFLRVMPPIGPIADASAVGDMFKRYERKAGIIRHPFDGKGFHGLRRRLAKKLLVAGTAATTIAQILGHDDVASVRQYLSFDINNLKECALGFEEIPMTRKELL